MGEEKDVYHLSQVLPTIAHKALYVDEPYAYNWVALDDEDMLGQVDRVFLFELGSRLADRHEKKKRMCNACNACAVCARFARFLDGTEKISFDVVVTHASTDVMNEAADAVDAVLTDKKARTDTLRSLVWSEHLINFVTPHIQPFIVATAFREVAVLKLIEKTRDACQIVATTH